MSEVKISYKEISDILSSSPIIYLSFNIFFMCPFQSEILYKILDSNYEDLTLGGFNLAFNHHRNVRKVMPELSMVLYPS